MKFTKIETNSERAMDGYKFNDEAATIDFEAFRRAYPYDTEMGLKDRISDDVDSFYDGFDTLATDEDGNLYQVLFHWGTHEPLIWCGIHED